MDRFVALYRGINVGGNRPVKMESLRAMHRRLGHRGVASYIQSGNVVFDSAGSAQTIAADIAAAFLDEFGFAPRIMVEGASTWRALIRRNPYASEASSHPKSVHAGICEGKPDLSAIGSLLQKTAGPERYAVVGSVVYLHAPDGLGNSRFAAGLERACGVPITVRNWRTVEAIAAMLEGAEQPRDPKRSRASVRNRIDER